MRRMNRNTITAIDMFCGAEMREIDMLPGLICYPCPRLFTHVKALEGESFPLAAAGFAALRRLPLPLPFGIGSRPAPHLDWSIT